MRTPGPPSPPRRSGPGAATRACTLTVKPVIDLADHVRVDAYEVPDRLKERIALRDLGCVFPWCTRPARTACDHDHAIPHDHGGPTCSCNVAPLCRHHHRLEDPHALALPTPRTRRLPVDLPARLRVPPRPLRHHRRHPRRADRDPRLPGRRGRHRPADRSSYQAPTPRRTPTGGDIGTPGVRADGDERAHRSVSTASGAVLGRAWTDSLRQDVIQPGRRHDQPR